MLIQRTRDRWKKNVHISNKEDWTKRRMEEERARQQHMRHQQERRKHMDNVTGIRSKSKTERGLTERTRQTASCGLVHVSIGLLFKTRAATSSLWIEGHLRLIRTPIALQYLRHTAAKQQRRRRGGAQDTQ